MRTVHARWIGGILSSMLLATPAGIAGKVPPLRVAYFTPSDREPIPGYVERIDRCMTEVQRFYREGMIAAGYGPLTFELERDDAGRLKVFNVAGKHPMETYGRDSSGDVRDEVKAALTPRGIDIDQETIVIFQVLLRWDGDKAEEVGSYVGGGGHLSGTAWVYDDAKLDPRKLDSKEPGGFYGRPCSIGEFNSHYLGGIAHELGHALGLPHDAQQSADNDRGESLMSGGNHTYGNNLRGEGAGTFLTAASAMPLKTIRVVAGDLKDAHKDPNCKLRELDARFQDGKIILIGALDAEPAAYGVVAYNDPAEPEADYEAIGWIDQIDADGRFKLAIGELQPGQEYQLRLRVCHVNGGSTWFPFDYHVAESGQPDIDVFRYSVPLDQAVDAYAAGERARMEKLSRELERRFNSMPTVCAKAAHLRTLLDSPAPRSLAEVPDSSHSVSVSTLAFAEESVGWGRPLRDQVLIEPPGQCFLSVDGQFYREGLFAHAPARHVLDLGGRWRRFRSRLGIQDGHWGTVVFVVRGDGRELFRSDLVNAGELAEANVSVADLDRLELIVEDGGDGPGNDWGIWVEPRLER